MDKKVGDKRTFNSEKGKVFEIKEIITGADLPMDWDYDLGATECPKCHEKIKITSKKHYTIDKIEVLEALDGQRFYLGYSKELASGDKPWTMRLPDKVFHPEKDMSDSVKAKSTYLK